MRNFSSEVEVSKKEGEKMQSSTKFIVKEVINEIKDLPDEQIANILQIIRIFKESIVKQREYDFDLKKEIKEWDKLSDEAFQNFESSI